MNKCLGHWDFPPRADPPLAEEFGIYLEFGAWDLLILAICLAPSCTWSHNANGDILMIY